MVRELHKEDDIDLSYYDDMVNAAIYGKGTGKNRKPGISDFGDFEQFVSDDPAPDVAPWFSAEDPNDVPWSMACGKDTCAGCPNLTQDGCKSGYDNSDFISRFDEDNLFMKR